MNSEAVTKGSPGGRALSTGSLRMRASKIANDALGTLQAVAVDATANPTARVDAAKAILGYATANIIK